MKKEKPTMRDVAKLAGVTQPTVSYVINGTAKVSEEVKERVYQAIKQLNYKPNYYAIALKTSKTNTIGLIIPDLANAYYSVMVSMVEKMLLEKGYMVLINSTDYQKTTEISVLKKLMALDVEGIIVMYQFSNPRCWEYLRESGKKVVVLEGGSACGDFPCIHTDSHYGGYIATKTLLKEGRTKIAYVGQTSEIETLDDRCRGYKDAMREHGFEDRIQIYRTKGPGDKWKEGTIIGEKLRDADVDGIVVSSDVIAVGILRTLLMSKINIPEEISIIGYDDIPLAELFVPSLTTVAQPIEEMSLLAVEKLLKLLNGEKTGNERLKPTLIVRETTRSGGA